jgi:lipoprotein-anchoring transpeptidase ErfK/SrfK
MRRIPQERRIRVKPNAEGSNEPSTIGHNVSSGCIRMMNEDVIDLYDRVPVGPTVVVL